MGREDVVATSTIIPDEAIREEGVMEVTSFLEEPLLPQESPGTERRESDHSSRRRSRCVSCDRLGEGERRCNGGRTRGGGGKKSQNINFILSFTVLSFAGRSLWSQSSLSAFVYLLRDSNPEFVGYLTALMGIAQLLASFPSGYLADKHRRDALIHTASAVGLIAAGVTTASVLTESYALLGAALSVWGIFWGMANTSISALFADSIRDGDRSRYFTYRMIMVKVGNLMGPLAALLMFAIQGDSWTTRDCAFVMGAGQIVCVPAMALLCFLSDEYAVVKEDNANTGCDADGESRSMRIGELREPLLSQCAEQAQDEEARKEEDWQLANTEHLTPEHSSDEDVEVGDVHLDDASSAVVESTSEDSSDEETRQNYCCCILESRRVPTLITAADLTGGIAAGMSVRYFPIFFLDNIHLDPVRVQIVYALSLVFQIVLSPVALKGGDMFGRCQMAAFLKWSGVLCFILLIVSYKMGLPPIIILAFFIGRMGLMNSTGALTKSMLMDSVPRKERGMWSSLESVNMFSWAGSAAIGGWLVQSEGIVFNFCITASLQVVATVPLVMLFGEVKSESDMRQECLASRRINGESIDEAEITPPRSESLDVTGASEEQQQRGAD